MMAPSGYGSVPSRAALIATSLPRMARRSLRLPSSWATEINRQSRYPGGSLIPKTGVASSSAPRAEKLTPPPTLSTTTAAVARRGICFMHRPFIGWRPAVRCHRRSGRADACQRRPAFCGGSAERERVRLHAGVQELDLELAIGDGLGLSDHLVQPLLGHRAVASLVNVDAVGRARRLSVDQHAKPY